MGQTLAMEPVSLVLASSSRYRASMLDQAGFQVLVDPPDVDERALDTLLDELGPDGLALELARRKAFSVASRHPGHLVVAGDQIGTVDVGSKRHLLTKQGTVQGAVAQLCTMAGTTHELVNGLVVLDTRSGRVHEGVDRQRVTMRAFSTAEAEQYVERFEPFDSSGSYRLEDQEAMEFLAPFVTGVAGEDPSGVLGLLLPLLGRLLESARS